MSELLTVAGQFKCKASSVLGRKAEFQAKHMFEDSDDCWNSAGKSELSLDEDGEDEGCHLLFDFLDASVCVTSIRIMFQGGFVGSDGIVEIGGADENKNALKQLCILDHIETIEDGNDFQEWDIPAGGCNGAKGIKYLKIIFPTSTDFYGRVTIYRFEIHGQRL